MPQRNTHLNRKGGLFVYRSERGRAADEPGWRLRREVGLHAEPLDRRQIEDMEPSLGPEAQCGYATNDWAHYDDPKALCSGLLAHLRQAGVEVMAAEITGIDFDAGRPAALVSRQGDKIAFDHVVIAAGAWSHQLSRQLGDPLAARGFVLGDSQILQQYGRCWWPLGRIGVLVARSGMGKFGFAEHLAEASLGTDANGSGFDHEVLSQAGLLGVGTDSGGLIAEFLDLIEAAGLSQCALGLG